MLGQDGEISQIRLDGGTITHRAVKLYTEGEKAAPPSISTKITKNPKEDTMTELARERKRARDRARYHANKEERKEYQRRYYAENREQCFLRVRMSEYKRIQREG